MSDNPLLAEAGLPHFPAIRPEHVEPAIDRLLADNRAQIAALLDANETPTFDTLIAPIEALEERLSRAWSPVSHLNAVMNSEALRAAYNTCLPKLSDYHTELGQNERLFRAFEAIAQGDEYARLDVAQKKIVDNALRDFRLSGVALPAAEKARFRAIMQELSELGAKYEENLLDATQAWHLDLSDDSRIAGLPDSARALLAQYAQQAGITGFRITLEYPAYLPVMTYAQDRALRREVYEAYATRASDQGPQAGRYDNSAAMERLLALRHEAARLLGYASYAELSLATKMAKQPDEVLGFLNDLASRSVARAKEEFAELCAFARELDGIETLESWDTAYYSEKLQQHRYALSQEELRPYFPVPRVVSGLFAVVERLYGIRIHARDDVEGWHPDVRFYEITDSSGQLRGQFYLDLYARAHKRGGAWMDECQRRMQGASITQTPVAYLTCNFTPPVGKEPALLTHDEVQTLFHEFGHGLHHMLTRVDWPSVAGINGVAWDAVELPSQFMENWCWSREALDLMATHYQTGAALPQDLFDKMLAAKNFQSAMQMVRQLEFSLLDFRMHLEYDPARGGRIYPLLDEVRTQVSVLKPPDFNRFAHGFSHIFAGGYAAGYYSYKWAEVLSADAFSAFEESGVFDRATGARFLETVLEQGGTREPMELFIAFRGRRPSIDALLRHSGLAA
jgi:oligopeptidase A